jgi:hypothetical protein
MGRVNQTAPPDKQKKENPKHPDFEL